MQIVSIYKEYRILNADITIKRASTMDDLILESNRTSVPCIYVLSPPLSYVLKPPSKNWTLPPLRPHFRRNHPAMELGRTGGEDVGVP